jgi:hypothetical protein
MSLRDDLIQRKAIMINYTQDIMMHIGKDITTLIKLYMDNYKVGSSNNFYIKLPVDEKIIKIVEKIYETNPDNNSLCKITKYFDFRIFKYNIST